MKLGLFYQSGYRIDACYNALKQFRKFYPVAPIALHEDNTNILLPVAKKFNCEYKKTETQGFNDPNSGRPAFDSRTMKGWLKRVYESCTSTLKDVDWVMNFEDDVWFIRDVKENPPYDLTGITGIGWHEDLYLHLNTKVRGAHGCGGSIFNRLKFIEAYENTIDLNWDKYDDLAVSPKPSQWTDSALTFLFLYSNFTIGSWSELAQYKNTKSNKESNDPRSHWEGSIKELEEEQGDVAVVHCWKPYYYPTEDEKKEVLQNLLIYNT